jgi:hypothetical protein
VLKKVSKCLEEGLKKKTRRLPRHYTTKTGMPQLPAALKRSNYMNLSQILSSDSEGNSAPYEKFGYQ